MAVKTRTKRKSVLDNAWVFLGDPFKKKKDIIRTWLEARNTLLHYGLPYTALTKLTASLHIEDPSEAPEIFHITKKTLQRRKKENRLKSDEAIRIFGIAEVMARAAGVFGNKDSAINWLKRPNRALDNEKPIMLLTDTIGKKLVEDLLGRIEHGIYS